MPRVIEPVANSLNYQLARKLLDASVLRQEAIATNIANAETPGFRRVDVAPDFATALRAQFAGGTTPAPGSLANLTPRLAEDSTVRAVRPDGNSVEIESELLAMSRNRVDHEFLTDLVSRNIKQLRMAITGRVT
ncbi:MAG: flagellar basal body rod protein FlgB [Opitutaceae bacterium]|jgi:flagellar basal-body rod protein FlgB